MTYLTSFAKFSYYCSGPIKYETFVITAKAGIQYWRGFTPWTLAFAGVTTSFICGPDQLSNLLLSLGEFIVNRLMIGLLFGSALNAFGIISAHALEFEQKENILFVSGNSIDFVDTSRLEKALAKGVNAIVLSKIGSGRIDVLAGLGRLIQKANVTTVATDLCGASCAYLFMAGRERRYGTLPGTTGQTPIFLALAGATLAGSSNDAHSTATYAYFRDAFSDAMPSDLLNKYTTGGKAGQLIIFTRPSKSFPEGEIDECLTSDDKTKIIDCKRVQGLTPMSVGALTSIEPFDLPDRTSLILSPVALAAPISVNAGRLNETRLDLAPAR